MHTQQFNGRQSRLHVSVLIISLIFSEDYILFFTLYVLPFSFFLGDGDVETSNLTSDVANSTSQLNIDETRSTASGDKTSTASKRDNSATALKGDKSAAASFNFTITSLTTSTTQNITGKLIYFNAVHGSKNLFSLLSLCLPFERRETYCFSLIFSSASSQRSLSGS